MATPLLELEGTWEEIEAQMPDLAGQRVRVLVYPLVENGTQSVNTRPIMELLAEIAASMPAEEIAKIPPDLSEQVDHYLYGAPKR